MIEKTILDYMKEHASVPAHMQRPENPADAFILIEKAGSGRENHVDESTIAIQSYAKSLYEAALLNEEVKELMESILELDEISSVQLNSDYNFTEPARKQYRYQAVFDITHY